MAGKPYSFKDLVGVFVHPLAGTFTFRGQVGLAQVSVANSTERTVHDVAADGAVMVTYVAGDNATCNLEMQQTSDLHKFLLGWYNICKTLADQDDISAWAAAEIHLRNVVDGSVHNLTGVSPGKNPDKVYASSGQRLTWTLMAANAVAS